MTISIRTILSLVVALFFGLIAAFLAQRYLNRETSSAQLGANGPLVNVVVAAQKIDRGVALQAAMLKVVPYPASAAPTGVFHNVSDLSGGQQRLALRSMVINEPILPDNVTDPGGKGNLSAFVAPGMRAVSIRSNDVAGVGGFVLPGDRVDVLLTRSISGGNQNTSSLTQIIAENVRVLGVDQSDNDEENKPVVAKAVTVEVTPEQAQSISLGESVGTVSLTLRHVADDAPLTQKLLTVGQLLPNTPHASHPRSGGDGGAGGVRVIRGVNSSHFNFAVGSALNKVSAEAPAGTSTP